MFLKEIRNISRGFAERKYQTFKEYDEKYLNEIKKEIYRFAECGHTYARYRFSTSIRDRDSYMKYLTGIGGPLEGFKIKVGECWSEIVTISW